MKIGLLRYPITLIILMIASCSNVPTATEEPTPFMTATKEIGPTVAVATEPDVEFDPSTADPVAPKEILEEISYFGGGGGVRCAGDEQVPTISFQPLDGELMTLSTMIVCGLQKGEIVKGIIEYPDGRTVEQSLMAEDEMGQQHVLLSFRPAVDDPPGSYTFIVEAEAGTVQAKANFSQPHGPHVFRVDDSHLLLYGFAPDESVKLIYFTRQGRFGGWQEYTVDADGQLEVKIIVETNAYDTYFWALGDRSGEAHLRQEDYWGRTIDWVQQQSIQKQFCSTLASRLSRGDAGRVTYTDGSEMRIREYPGLEAEIAYKVPEGTLFTIVEGPTCFDEVLWWKVRTADGLEGWMAEEYEGVYLLEPYP